jgi:hypothetical protein
MGLNLFSTIGKIARLPKTSNHGFERSTNAKDLDAQMKEFFMTFRSNLNPLKNRIFTGALVLILACIFALPTQVYAKDIPSTLPQLDTFIETVKNGDVALRGVYVPNVMAFAIEKQPVGYPGYVSTADSVVTQFSIATEVGNVGLLAHNTHAGASFTGIQQGDSIILVYGDGRIETFMTQSIQRYQALEPLNPYSQFRDIETQTTFTAEELFNNVYRGDYHLTLQTCIENNGNASWGRLFIVATPAENAVVAESESTANPLAAFVNKRHIQ